MMNTFCVYYDLDEPDEQYPIVSAYLCNFPTFTRVGERMWLINTNTTCANIRDEMNTLPMPKGYKIVVMQVGAEWASAGIREQSAEWLKKEWKPSSGPQP